MYDYYVAFLFKSAPHFQITLEMIAFLLDYGLHDMNSILLTQQRKCSCVAILFYQEQVTHGLVRY